MFATPFVNSSLASWLPSMSLTITIPSVTGSFVWLVTLTPTVTFVVVLFNISTLVFVGILVTSITVMFSSGVPIALLLVALLAR